MFEPAAIRDGEKISEIVIILVFNVLRSNMLLDCIDSLLVFIVAGLFQVKMGIVYRQSIVPGLVGHLISGIVWDT